MIAKSEMYPGMFLMHKLLGIVSIDNSCIFLNIINNKLDSVFVVLDDEITEVTLSFLERIE